MCLAGWQRDLLAGVGRPLVGACAAEVFSGALARPGRLAISPPLAFLAGAPDAAASDRHAPGEPGGAYC
jgi:hypothetical protein